MSLNAIELAQSLIQIPSMNPPGDEKNVMNVVSQLLCEAGLDVKQYEFSPGRPSIVATISGRENLPHLVFTGHLDVVPLGEQPWKRDPFAGEIADGNLHGRGSADMKSGVAAFIAATLAELKRHPNFRRGISLVITAAEESGCEGAFHLSECGALGDAFLIVVAEPTSNSPVSAHKGSLRLRIAVQGKTAHSSMPDVGVNAIYKMVSVIKKLETLDLGDVRHPLLGAPTLAVTIAQSGLNINSIPDAAEISVDIRTLPEQDHSEILSNISKALGEDVRIETLTNFPGISSDLQSDALIDFGTVYQNTFKRKPNYQGAAYFTDASALVPGYDNAPAVIIGPGETEMCHQTDEYCPVEHIGEARTLYENLINRFCR